jgi:negative regulator of flagellin synthesis FlgM
MKIGQFDKNNGAATPVATERKGAPAASAQAPAVAGQPAPEASTQVALSTGAQAAAAALPDGNGDFDAEKVQRIAQAIREGRFTVNAEAIADKLIANAQDLLSGKPSTH